MNIALMSNHFNTGGISSYVLSLSRGLSQRGHRVWVFSSHGNCVQFLPPQVAHVPVDIQVKSEAHPRVWLSFPKIAGAVRRHGIQIMHANTRVTQVLAAAFGAVSGVPYVSTCHGFFKPRLSRRLLPCWGERVIAVSQGVRTHLLRDFRVPPERICLIPNGIDADGFASTGAGRQECRRQFKCQGSPVIGIIARLSSVKGIHVLVEAFGRVRREFPQAELWIVGQGDEQGNLQQQAAGLGLTNAVRFEPVVNRPADILPVFDLFVMPSLQEGLGLSVMEAQAAGITVVASNVGGLPDLIQDGKTGFLVEPNSPDALAQKIVQVLRAPEHAKAVAQAAAQQVRDKFSLDGMVAATVHCYESCLHA